MLRLNLQIVSRGMLGLLPVVLSVMPALAAPRQSPPNVQLDPFNDSPEAFVPKAPISEAEQDRRYANAKFAEGRLHFQRQNYAEALAAYQRAYRYDEAAESVLREIVPLAFQLKRNDEAARYAVIMAEKDPRDPLLLRRLAMHLTDQSDFDRALSLYEKAAAAGPEKKDAASVLTRLEMGRLYFLTGKFDKATACFEVVRDALDNPNEYGLNEASRAGLLRRPEATYLLMGESFLETGNHDAALAMFREADNAKTDTPTLVYRTARVYAAQDKTAEALKELEKYFAAKGSTAGVAPYKLFEELTAKQIKDEKKAAAATLQRLEKLQADDAENRPLGYFLAGKLQAADRLDEAVKIYTTLGKERPAVEGYRGLVEIYQQQNKLAELLDVLGEIAEKTGNLESLGETREELSENEKLTGELVDLALQRLEDKENKIDRGVALAGALLAAGNKQFDAADKLIPAAAAEEKEQQAALMMSWGLQMLLADENERAIKVFQQAIDDKLAPANNPAFHFYLAGALEMAGKTDAALEAAKHAAEVSGNPRFKSRVAWISYHAKRYDEAEQAYRELLEELDAAERSAENRDVARDARMVMSNIGVSKQDMPQAEERLEEVLDEFPEDIGAQNDLGYLWADQNKHLNRALKMIERAVADEPDNTAYLDSLGWVHYRLGNSAEAVKYMEQAVGGDDSPDGVLLDHLADSYLSNGQTEKALEAWKRAEKAFQESKLPEKAKAVAEKIKKHTKK